MLLTIRAWLFPMPLFTTSRITGPACLTEGRPTMIHCAGSAMQGRPVRSRDLTSDKTTKLTSSILVIGVRTSKDQRTKCQAVDKLRQSLTSAAAPAKAKGRHLRGALLTILTPLSHVETRP